MKFQTKLLQTGTNTTGIEVPDEVVAALGKGKKPPVRVTVNGFTYRSSVAVMGGKSLISVSAENRKAAGIAGGDAIEVELELDDMPREVTVPDDFAAALGKHAEAQRNFDGLAYSHKLRHVLSITEAKTPETRQRRIEKAIETLKAGKS